MSAVSLSQVLKEVSQFIQSLICQTMIGHLIPLPEQISFSCSFPSGGLFHISRCSSGDRQESGLPETASHQCLPYMTPSPMSLSLSLCSHVSVSFLTLLSVFITVDLVLYHCFIYDMMCSFCVLFDLLANILFSGCQSEDATNSAAKVSVFI